MMKRSVGILCLAMTVLGFAAPSYAQNVPSVEWGIAKENFKVDTARRMFFVTPETKAYEATGTSLVRPRSTHFIVPTEIVPAPLGEIP